MSRKGPKPRLIQRGLEEQDLESMMDCAGSSLRLKMEARKTIRLGDPLLWGLSRRLRLKRWRSRITATQMRVYATRGDVHENYP